MAKKFARGVTKNKMSFERSYFGEQPPKPKQQIQMTNQRGPLKVAILTNVQNLAKMTSMEKIRQPLNYMPNKIAKGPL